MDKNHLIVFTGRSQVELLEADIPVAGANQVLVKLEVSQISTGTELTYLEGNVGQGSAWEKDIVFPRYPGYSGIGKIVAVGEGVSEELIGKRIGTSLKHQQYQVVNMDRIGNGLQFIPEGVAASDAVFATISCITMASIRGAKIRPGDVCVVFGAGLVGQLVARNARLAGASTVIVADVSDLRLGLAPKEPGFITINSKTVDMPQYVLSQTEGRGADIVFETTSLPTLIETEAHCLCKRGTLVITSSPKGKSTLDFEYCCRKGLTIIGAHNHAIHTPVETPADRWTRNNDTRYFLELASKKMIDVDQLHTHKYHYKDAVSAYEMLMADRTQALSVIIDWED